MAAIDQYLRQILEATYGEEVRHSIHDAIKQNYMDVSDSVRQANEAAEAAEGAVAQANQATANVNAVVDRADQASSTANEASQRATSAASRVEAIEQKYENATATATQLAEGAAPTASLTDGPNGKIFSFGIPKGRTGDKGETGATGPKGDTGATPQIGVGTVSTGAAGSQAEVTISGTKESPLINFKIPKGDTGATGPQGPKGDTGEVKNVYANTIPMSPSDSTSIASAIDIKLNGKKSTQNAVSDPTASGTTVEFISSISQNAQGVIYPSKKTVREMGGASANAAGSTGLVPAPAKGDQGKFLNGAGQWQTPINTKNTAGSTDSSSKLFLIGATSQAASPQTYSHDTAYVGTDGCLYSGGKKVLTDHQDISGKVPTSRKINNKALSADITLTGEDIPVSSSNASSLSQQLDSKFRKNDLIFSNVAEIKNYLITTYGNQIGEFFDFLSVVHTDNSESVITPHKRWIGYVCKDIGGNTLQFFAHNAEGSDVYMTYYFGTQSWAIRSQSNQIDELKPFFIYGTTIASGAGFAVFNISGVDLTNRVGIAMQIKNSDNKWYAAIQGIAEMGVGWNSDNTPALYFTNSTDASWRNRPCRALYIKI